MDLGLTDKVAVVTGGSRGIGKSVARGLAMEGADVVILARNQEVLDATTAEIAAESGRKIRGYIADTRSNESVRSVFAAIAADFGSIDILVNNAAQPGGQGKVPGLAEITDDFFNMELDTKVMGYLRCAREAVPHMQRTSWGRIINISGLAARQTGTIVGSIRNVGVAALTKNLADEYGRFGINVTCVHPGYVRTEKSKPVWEKMAADRGVSITELEADLARRNTIHHILSSDEVAQIVIFLASPRSIAINGDVIGAGGGSPGPIFY